MRWPLLLLEAYVICTGLLILTAVSRSLFTNEPPRWLAMTKAELFWTTVIAASFWPLALLSRAGRRTLSYLVEGDFEKEEDDENG